MTVPAMISFLLVRGLYASHKTFPREIIELKKQKQKQKQTNKQKNNNKNNKNTKGQEANKKSTLKFLKGNFPTQVAEDRKCSQFHQLLLNSTRWYSNINCFSLHISKQSSAANVLYKTNMLKWKSCCYIWWLIFNICYTCNNSCFYSLVS